MEDARKSNIKHYILEAIMFGIMFIGFVLPEFSLLPPYGVQILCIFLGLLWGWSTVGLIMPSIAGLLALAFTEGFTIKTVWASGFASEIVILILLFCIFSKWLETVGFTNTLVNWFLTRKCFYQKPWLFITGFFLTIYLLGLLTSVFPAIFIGWACAYKLCEILGYEKRSPFCAFLVFNICMIGNMGDSSKPWSAWGLTTMNSYNSVIENGVITYASYMIWCIIVYLSIIFVSILFGKYIMKIDMSLYNKGDYRQAASAYEFDNIQKFAAALLVLMIIILFIPAYLPECTLKTILSTMGTIGAISVVLILASILNKANGQPLFDFGTIAGNGGVNWTPIMLLTVTVPLGAALKAPEAGIMQIVSELAISYLDGLSPYVFYLVIAILLGVLTQVAHNLVLLTAFAPIFAQVGSSLGMSPEIIMMIASLMLTAALGSPAGSTRSGLLYGNTEYIKLSDSYKYGWLSLGAHIVMCMCVGIPLGMLIF